MDGHQSRTKSADAGSGAPDRPAKSRRARVSKKGAFASLCSTLKLGKPGQRATVNQSRRTTQRHTATDMPACSLRFILSTNGRDYTYLGNGPQLGVNKMTKEQWDEIALKPLNPFFQFRTCAKNKNRFAGMQRQECRIVELFAAEWNRMSPEEQLPYEQMAAAARFEFKLLEQSVVIVDEEDPIHETVGVETTSNRTLAETVSSHNEDYDPMGLQLYSNLDEALASWPHDRFHGDDEDVLDNGFLYGNQVLAMPVSEDSLAPYADSSAMYAPMQDP